MKSARWMSVAGMMLLLCAALAQTKPNFSGDWKMNPAKSDFGQMPAPSSMVQKITHDDPSLKVVATTVSERGEFTRELAYTTDGKECINKTRMGEFKSTLKWDANTLVIETKSEFQGNPFATTSKWTLSQDGKVLTVASHFSSSMGEGDSKVVYEKQ